MVCLSGMPHEGGLTSLLEVVPGGLEGLVGRGYRQRERLGRVHRHNTWRLETRKPTFDNLVQQCQRGRHHEEKSPLTAFMAMMEEMVGEQT